MKTEPDLCISKNNCYFGFAFVRTALVGGGGIDLSLSVGGGGRTYYSKGT